MSFFAVTLTLFFVIDALGNIPTYLHLLKSYDKRKRMRIALRELCIALLIMIAFNYVGQGLLTALRISPATVQISAGIVLFLIAIRLIFSENHQSKWQEHEPFIVPIATPIIAGPSVLAIIMIFAKDESVSRVLGAIFLSWLLSSIVFLFAQPIYNLVKEK
jgi:multiple antibiotic resistance protein